LYITAFTKHAFTIEKAKKIGFLEMFSGFCPKDGVPRKVKTKRKELMTSNCLPREVQGKSRYEDQ